MTKGEEFKKEIEVAVAEIMDKMEAGVEAQVYLQDAMLKGAEIYCKFANIEKES
jgi:hypothetical protein